MESAEDRRIDQVVGKLQRYGVVMAALQETKWFGNGIYKVDWSVMLEDQLLVMGR